MADLRIVDAPEIPTNNITGREKIPTGGSGNYSITLDSLADYTKTKKDLADKTSVDGKVNGVRQELDAHIEDLTNPHQVTKSQIGLGNVDNTADADKPVSNSTQAAIISAVTPKADKSYVDNQLVLKADNDEVKRGIANRYDSSLTYNSGERVVLTNGDIVKSSINGNTNDPNVNLTGWRKPQASEIFDESGETQQEINSSVIYQCDTVADLATVFPRGTNHIVHVRRYSTTSKYVGGVDYRWDATNTDAANGFETIASPFSATGRWKAVFKNNVMNAWSLGYFGDGTTDNSVRHKAVSKWMHENNENRRLVFSNGEFLFNGESGNFFLVSNTDYQIKPTAKITGGSSFDDNGTNFGQSYDTNQYLDNVTIYGGGTFDMSGTGYQRTARHFRTILYIPKQRRVTLDNIRFTGGDYVWTVVTGVTPPNFKGTSFLAKNCTFDLNIVDASKNIDFTAFYVNSENAVIRNNIFNANCTRAKMIGTAVEFHHNGGSLLNNTFNDVSVGVYIAQQEGENAYTNNILIQGNNGTCVGLFVAYWTEGGVQRYAVNNSIIGNTIRQSNYPTADEQMALGFAPRSSGLSFIAFIHTDSTENQLPLITGGLTISGNSFTHSQDNAESTFINFISQAPHSISAIGNDLRVAHLITTPSHRLSKPISKLTMRQNTINGEYLSGNTSPVLFRAHSVTDCVIDLSDITYPTPSKKTIPLITWDVASTGNHLNTIIEGEYSYHTYSTVLYPEGFFDESKTNTVSHVFTRNINIPATTTAGAVLASVPVDIPINSKLRVLSASIGLESTLTLPVYLSRRTTTTPYAGVGYTTQAIAEPVAIGAVFYTTRA